MAKTPNLNLDTDLNGLGTNADTLAANFEAIDAAVGDVAAVEVLDGAGGDPVEGDLADKLAALEARVVALETA